jgi:hypothetical protein
MPLFLVLPPPFSCSTRYRQRLQAVDAWMQDMELPQSLADSV